MHKIKTAEPKVVWKSNCILGEGTLWVKENNSIYFVDIKKKRIYIFDNEHAKWQNRLAFRSATSILCPSKIDGDYIKYQGIKEAIYLCEFSPNSSILDKIFFQTLLNNYITFT